MTSTIWRCLILSICFIYVYPEFERSQRYLHIDILENIAMKISRVFDEINTLSNPSDETYKHKIAVAMERIMDEVAFYGEITDNMDYLDEIDFDNLTIREKYKCFKEVTTVSRKINMEYNRFKQIVQSLKKENGSVLVTKPAKYPDLMELYNRLHSIITFGDKNGDSIFLYEFISRTQVHACNHHLPPKQYIMFQIYLTLTSSLLKAFTVSVLDHQFQFIIDKNMTLNQLDAKVADKLKTVERMLEEDLSVMNDWIGLLENKIENCPLTNWTRDVNFIELERVFQLIVVSERILSADASCWRGCGNTSANKISEEKCRDGYCVLCEGSISDCRSEEEVSFCISSDSKSSRRYEWMTFAGMGKPDCPNANVIVLPIHKSGVENPGMLYLSFVFSFFLGPACEMCICTCEENTKYSTKSTFTISSELITSDVDKNMVVTGLKFTKVERIIYIQIRQAKLMPGGVIDQNTAHWKPITPLNRKNNRDNKSSIIISKNLNKVNLNDLFCPSDEYVVTGVGLGMSKSEKQANRIALFIRCSLVDFVDGVVLSNNTGPIEDLRPHEYKASTGPYPADRTNDTYDRDYFEGYYVEFTMSDPVLDAGQSVIPWFDARSVTSKFRDVPFGGIGLHHIRGEKSGGILILKPFSIKYYLFM